MKHKHSISCLLAAAAAASMACSCTKEDAARFEGDYSFKTSGTLTISADGTDGTVTIGDTIYPIIASDVDCVAHEND